MGIQSISRELKSRITFPSLILDDFYIKEFEYSGSLLTKDEFEIGTAPAMRLKIKLIDDTGALKSYNFENKECNAEIGINTIIDGDITYQNLETYTYQELESRYYDTMASKGYEYHSLGLFTVEKAVRVKDTITLECIDRMYKAEVPYIDNLTYPATVLQVFQRACSIAGLSIASTVFANADYLIPHLPVYENVSVRKILASVAELAGGYAIINKQGQIEIITLEKVITSADIDKDTYINLKFDEVAPAYIDKVVVKVGDQESIAGSGNHPYTILNNLLVQNPANVVSAIHSVLNGLNYSPVQIKWQGDWTLNFGDRVSIYDDEVIRYSYLFDRKITYRGGVREEFKAPNKSDLIKNSTGKGSLTLDVNQIKTEIKIISGEIDQVISDVNGNISNINQTIDSISQSVQTKASIAEVNILSDKIESKVSQQDVQDMIDQINQANPNLITNLSENWEQGTINSTTGILEDSDYVIRSKAYFPIRQGHVTFKVSPLYEALIVIYSNGYAFSQSAGFANQHTFLLPENSYFKMAMRRVNNALITPEAINTAELKVENSQEPTRYQPYLGDLTLDQQQDYYILDVQSNNGWVVDEANYTATLTARIYLFNEDVTVRFEPYQFTWLKRYPDGTLENLGNGKSKVITSASLSRSATITCEFEILDTIYLLATYNGDTLLTISNDNLMVIGDYQ